MKKILLLVLLPGCSLSPAETAWQGLHLVDVAQTLNGPAADPCYPETGPAKLLIGETPSREAVLAWGIGAAILHFYADRWLARSAIPDGWKTVLRSLSIGYKGSVVVRNHNVGIRPFGDNQSCTPPKTYRPDAQPIK